MYKKSSRVQYDLSSFNFVLSPTETEYKDFSRFFHQMDLLLDEDHDDLFGYLTKLQLGVL